MARRVGRSHAVTNGVAKGGNVAFQENVAAAMELVVAHTMAMETGCPIVYMGIRKGFIVLG